jgi:ABC-type nickel/cobalt efflux system permease component RcnA
MSTGRLLYTLGLFAVLVFSAGIALVWALSYGPL